MSWQWHEGAMLIIGCDRSIIILSLQHHGILPLYPEDEGQCIHPYHRKFLGDLSSDHGEASTADRNLP
jgi:hypothetical protein